MQTGSSVFNGIRLVDIYDTFVRVLTAEEATDYLARGKARPIGNPRRIEALQLYPLEPAEDPEFPGRALSVGAITGQRDVHQRETPTNPRGVWAFRDGLLRGFAVVHGGAG